MPANENLFTTPVSYCQSVSHRFPAFKKQLIFSLLLVTGITASLSAGATKKTAVGNAGNGWSNASNWSPSGVPQQGDTVEIPSSLTLTVKGTVYNSVPDIFIIVRGILDFDPSGKLELGSNSALNVFGGGQITSNGSSSEIIRIGNIVKFNGQIDGTILGPSYASSVTGQSPNGFTPGILSIKLISFDYLLAGGGVQLNWTAVSDNADDYFEVQKSSNGTDWMPLTRIPVSNGSSEVYQYRYTDAVPGMARAYYRIRLYNAGHRDSYSKILSINLTNGDAKLFFAPNPATGTARINWNYPGSSESLSLKIFNTAGACVWQENLPATDTFRDLSLGDLSSGIYRMMLSDNLKYVSGTTFILKN